MVEDQGGYLESFASVGRLGRGFAAAVDGKGKPDLSECCCLVEFDDFLHAGLHFEPFEIFCFRDGLVGVFEVWADVGLAGCF